MLLAGNVFSGVLRDIESACVELQEAFEGGRTEEQEKITALEGSLAQAQADLRESEAAKQALQERLEEQEEKLYNQVSSASSLPCPFTPEASGVVKLV